MKNLILLSLIIAFLCSCQKDEYPDIKMEPAPVIPKTVDTTSGVNIIYPDSI